MKSSSAVAAIRIICVVDFMCPWSFIGLKALERAIFLWNDNNNNNNNSSGTTTTRRLPIQVHLLPFEFDPPGTYSSDGQDWTEYCQSFGPPKAKFLLEEKLPRAFRLGKDLGIHFQMKRRIVHTETVNCALMLVQDASSSSESSCSATANESTTMLPNRALQFALRILSAHFEDLKNPNDPDVLRPILQNDIFNLRSQSSSAVDQALFATETAAQRSQQNEDWTIGARRLGAPPVPLFRIECFPFSRQDMTLRVQKDFPDDGPTTPEYFLKVFEVCQTESTKLGQEPI